MTSMMKKLNVKMDRMDWWKWWWCCLRNYVFGLWQHQTNNYSTFSFPFPFTSASLLFPLLPWYDAPDPGAGRPITTSLDFGSEGLDFRGLDCDLFGMEGGTNVGSSFSFSEESSSEELSNEKSYSCSGIWGWLGSPTSCFYLISLKTLNVK